MPRSLKLAGLSFNRSRLVVIFLILILIIGGFMAALLYPDFRPALPHTERSPIRPETTGTFTQPWCVDKYASADQWDAEFTAMQSAGIDLWIYQWTADSGHKTTIYPTRLPGWQQSSVYDQVEMALATAKRHQMKVYMGLAFNDAWWQKESSDRAWLQTETSAMSAVADELYDRYYSRYPDTFAGWYINWEMDNANGYNFLPADKKNIIEALAGISSHLKALNPRLPAAIAPFFNSRIGASPRRWQYFWYDVLRETQVDILMLQDGVGVNHASVEQLPQWFGAVCDAAHAAGKQCWSDLENFTSPSGSDSGPFSPAPPERVAAQHRAVAPYVDRIVTFSFIAYMSPAWGVDPKYLAAYQAFRK